MPEGVNSRALQSPIEPSRRAAYCLALTIVIALALRMGISLLLHPLRIGWDIALHLMCASLICQGKLPYVDMFDVNPPLIWYINTIPASLANLLHVPVTITFNFFLLFMIAGSGLMCAYVILKKLEIKDVFVNLGIVLGLILFNFFLTVDFGQREEIFVLLFAPFLFLRLARWRGAPISRGEAILYGVVGAAGVFMKHYFVLNFLVVEIYFLLSSRSKGLKDVLRQYLTTEMLALVVFGAAYAGHFLIMPPAVRENYFNFLLPAFSKGYNFWDTTVPNCMAMPGKRNIFMMFSAAGALALALLRVYPLLGALVSFGMAGVVVYLMQFKGWAYQDIPVMAGAFMLAGALAGAAVSWLVIRFSARKKAATVAAYACSVLIAGTCFVSASDEINQAAMLPKFDMSVLGYLGSAPKEDIDTPFTEVILANTSARDPIVFISNAVAPGFPITLQLRRAPASRHLHVCILSVLHFIRGIDPQTPETKRLLAYEPRVVQELGEDIHNTKPKLVFLQDMPIKSEYLAPYNFEREYLSDYKQIGDISNFTVFKLNDPDANSSTPPASTTGVTQNSPPASGPVPAGTPTPNPTPAAGPVPAIIPAAAPVAPSPSATSPAGGQNGR